MDANLESGATDVDGAALRISSLLGAKQEGLPTKPKQEAAKEQPEQPEAEQIEPETPEGDTEAEEPRYKVKVNGEEKEVTIEDLRKGYMMESDYRKKTSDVSEQRKALEAKQVEIDSQLAEAKELLDIEIENLTSPEMQELKEYDPEKYLKEFEKVQKKQDKFNKLKAKREQEQLARQQELSRKEFEALVTAIPDWMDESVRNKEAAEVFSKMREIGYTDAELSNLTDHRAFVMARKALMLDKIQSQKIEAKEVKKPPKVQQPGNAKVIESDPKVKDSRDRLKKTGNVNDAVDYFKTLFK